MATTTEHLLANREAISLDAARLYLSGRQRVRTPFGAAEYLRAMKHGEAEMQKSRLGIAANCMQIYRDVFPEDYARSPAPYCSLQREQELYALIHANLFPLVRSEDDLSAPTRVGFEEFMQSEPEFFLPYIPIRGAQESMWHPGAFDFFSEEIEYQVALALSRECDVMQESWEALQELYDLDPAFAPAPPLATVGWSLFRYSCLVEGKPLSWLPMAFHFISYKTGNMFLDMPPIGAMGVEWSLEQVFQLTAMWDRARNMLLALKGLGVWLEASPRERITHIVQLWNDAWEKEQQSGFEGQRTADIISPDYTMEWM